MTHLYPVRMFKSVDFPAPEGPMIAVNSPDRRRPLTDFRIVFASASKSYNFTCFPPERQRSFHLKQIPTSVDGRNYGLPFDDYYIACRARRKRNGRRGRGLKGGSRSTAIKDAWEIGNKIVRAPKATGFSPGNAVTKETRFAIMTACEHRDIASCSVNHTLPPGMHIAK